MAQADDGSNRPPSPEQRTNKTDTGHSALVTEDVNRPTACTRKPTQAARWQRILLDTWVPEVLAITTSTACLIAIVVVLRVFNGRIAPTLPYGITLNAIIATLATTARSSLMYTVATAISQLKWCWYQKSRKLEDVQIFDDASRGPWGSISLLFFLRARPLASLGAVITILALGFDPFIQLILTYPERMVPSDELKTPSLTRATDFMADPTTTDWSNAIESGISFDPQSFYQQPSCPTSRCTWPNFRSMGWCQKCTDASSYLQVSDCDLKVLMQTTNKTTACKVNFGHGDTTPLFQNLGNEYPHYPTIALDKVWMLDSSAMPPRQYDNTYPKISYPLNTTHLGILNPVINIAHVTIDDPVLVSNISISKAEECVLSLCDVEYSVAFSHGNVDTEIVDTDYGFIKYYTHNGPAGVVGYDETFTKTCWQANNSTAENQHGSFDRESHNNSFFCPSGLGSITRTADFSSERSTTSFAGSILDHLSGNATAEAQFVDNGKLFLSKTNYSSPVAQYIAEQSLSKALNGVAASLSKVARSSQNQGYTVQVSGEAYVSETYVQIAWYWLVFPLTMDLFGIIFLVLAIVQSRLKKMRPWKSSVLPLLYHGLEAGTLSRRPVSEDVSAMARVAEDAEVRLAYSDRRAKTMLKQS